MINAHNIPTTVILHHLIRTGGEGILQEQSEIGTDKTVNGDGGYLMGRTGCFRGYRNSGAEGCQITRHPGTVICATETVISVEP